MFSNFDSWDGGYVILANQRKFENMFKDKVFFKIERNSFAI